MGIDCWLDLEMRIEKRTEAMEVWDALMIRTTSRKLSWYRGLSSVPGMSFEMSRLATLLLRLGPAKFARPRFDLHPKSGPLHHEVSLIAICLCRLRGTISTTSMRP